MKIKNTIKEFQGKTIDKTKRFKRQIELKRLEKYANEIDMVLTLYNKKSCDETMMIKGLRRFSGETTVRKTHQEDVEKITKEIAKKLGLNEQIVGIMAKHHDIGHTFLGHSGEWWISNIQEDDGLGMVCHNAVGARELVFTDHIYEQIIDKIKVHNPEIGPKELGKIRESLWLIMDGINTHNGETPEKEYIPNVRKTEKDFESEMLKCYGIRGYDRTIKPATAEASLMRLADQISYIPLDMVDGLREGLVRDKDGNIVDTLDEDYIRVLTALGIDKTEIDIANKEKSYSKIAERLKEIFVNDVIANSTKGKITMSPRVMTLMNELRNLNNQKAVNNVILKEDQETYPLAIRELRDKYAKIFLEESLDEKIKQRSEKGIQSQRERVLATTLRTSEEMALEDEDEAVASAEYSENDEKFIRYVLKSDARDLQFTKRSAQIALRESIGEELDIARDHVLNQKVYQDKEELGLDYTKKNARIKSYISRYMRKLNEGEMVGYSEETRQAEIETIYKGVLSGKLPKYYEDMKVRVAKLMAGKYIASLNDSEFLRLLEQEEFVSQEQVESLTRKYKDIEDLQEEVYIQSNWKSIAKAQEKSTEIQGEVK